MITWLQGRLERIEADVAIVNVNGFGIELYLPPYAIFPFELGAEHRIPVHLRIVNTPGEVSLTIYGFATEYDKQIFLWLLTQKGIGPKQALSLTGLGADQLLMALVNNDWLRIAALPGIGKKTAQRLCVTLADSAREKLGASGLDTSHIPAQSSTTYVVSNEVSDALAALMALGYSEPEARKYVLAAREANPNADSAELIRLALKAR